MHACMNSCMYVCTCVCTPTRFFVSIQKTKFYHIYYSCNICMYVRGVWRRQLIYSGLQSNGISNNNIRFHFTAFHCALYFNCFGQVAQTECSAQCNQNTTAYVSTGEQIFVNSCNIDGTMYVCMYVSLYRISK